MRLPLLASILLVVATACGAVEEAGGPSKKGLEPPPPIRAVEEPAPNERDDDIAIGDRDFGVAGFICPAGAATEAEIQHECRDMTESELRVVKKEAEFLHAPAPAAGTERRIVAELDLGDQLPGQLIAWRSSNGRLCFRTALGRGAEAAISDFGPCLDDPACTEVCLEEATVGETTLLAGVVARSADALRVDLGGTVKAYPLVGPELPSSPSHRVFMLGLRRGETIRALQLFREGELVTEQDGPALVVRIKVWCAEAGLRPAECAQLTPLGAGGRKEDVEE